MVNKRLINTGVEAAAEFDPLQNFETVTYTGNGSTQKITGYIRKGAAFNGSSSVVNLPAYFSNPNTNSSTLSVWFKSNINDGNLRSIFSNRNVSGGAAYDIYTINGELRFAHEGNLGGNGVVDGTTTVTDGDWHHIAVVLDNPSGALNIYLDGNTSSAEITLNFTANSSLNLFGLTSYIGSTFFAERYFDGSIDQVRIFDKAISSSEVTTLYGETYDSSTKSTTDIFGDSSGVALYELDEDANDTGGTYNGTPTNVNFLGMAFQPDFVWFKERNGTNAHQLYDSVRGDDFALFSNNTDAEFNYSTHPNGDLSPTFLSNGFQTPSVTNNGINRNTGTYVAWCWKAGGTVSANNNTDGTIDSTVSANQDAGFSIVSYSGNNGSSATIGHGLSSAPELVIIKARNFAAGWPTLAAPSGTIAFTGRLNETGATSSPLGSVFFNSTAPTSSVFTVGGSDEVNDGYNYIAYCFHSVDGYQKVGSYSGNGSSTGNTVTLGFRPRFILGKETNGVDSWWIVDSVRDASSPHSKVLKPDSSNAEFDNGVDSINFTDTGFNIQGSSTSNFMNESGKTYIYLAIA